MSEDQVRRFFVALSVIVTFTHQLSAAEPFEDATERVGLMGLSGGVAAWADFDGDGLVDLYVGGYETWTVANYVDVIYRNQGDGTFKETWRSKGGPQPARGITAADYDDDGELDVYVSNYRLVPNLLWKNDGEEKLSNAAAEFGQVNPESTIAQFESVIDSRLAVARLPGTARIHCTYPRAMIEAGDQWPTFLVISCENRSQMIAG